jgi:hypothetical protein
VTEKLNPGDSADEIKPENRIIYSFKNNIQFGAINSPGGPLNVMFLH